MSILSFSKSLASPLFLHQTPLILNPSPQKPTLIRMGGGPRTFPGGVSKWQWKRMQAKKAKQLLKARLTRERQIYEMRKRAELKAAVSDLERPWEPVEKPPNLFSVSADQQVKVLADRFQKPGGFDLWTERDGPELFRTMEDLPSARFFPKGVVHSVRPYRRIGAEELDEEEEGFGGVKKLVEGLKDSQGGSNTRRTYNGKLRRRRKGSEGNGDVSGELSFEGGDVGRKQRGQGNVVRRGENGGVRSRGGGVERRQRGEGGVMRGGESSVGKFSGLESEVFDMRLREDGSYEFQ